MCPDVTEGARTIELDFPGATAGGIEGKGADEAWMKLAGHGPFCCCRACGIKRRKGAAAATAAAAAAAARTRRKGGSPFHISDDCRRSDRNGL